jgi:hypothetical protein
MQRNVNGEQFGGRIRMSNFLDRVDPETITFNARKDGRIVSFNENEPIFIETDAGYEFVLSGMVNGKLVRTRVYPVTHRANSSWCYLEDSGVLKDIVSTNDGVPVDIDEPICKRFGTREEVFKGLARKTTGGLTASDLVEVDGDYFSVKEYQSAKKRLKIQTRMQQEQVEEEDEDLGIYSFDEVADGLDIDQIVDLQYTPSLWKNYSEDPNVLLNNRIWSMVSIWSGYDELNKDGTPYGLSEEELANWESIYDQVLQIMQSSGIEDMNDRVEYAIRSVFT